MDTTNGTASAMQAKPSALGLQGNETNGIKDSAVGNGIAEQAPTTTTTNTASSLEMCQYVYGHVDDFIKQFAASHEQRDGSNGPNRDSNSFTIFEIPFCIPPDESIVHQTTRHCVYEGHKVLYLHWCIQQPKFQKQLLKKFKDRAALDKPIPEEWLSRNMLFVFKDMKPRRPRSPPPDSVLAKHNDFWVHVKVPQSSQLIQPEDISSRCNRFPYLLCLLPPGGAVLQNSSFPMHILPPEMGTDEQFKARVDNSFCELFKELGGYFGGQNPANYESVSNDCSAKRRTLIDWEAAAAAAVAMVALQTSQLPPSPSRSRTMSFSNPAGSNSSQAHIVPASEPADPRRAGPPASSPIAPADPWSSRPRQSSESSDRTLYAPPLDTPRSFSNANTGGQGNLSYILNEERPDLPSHSQSTSTGHSNGQAQSPSATKSQRTSGRSTLTGTEAVGMANWRARMQGLGSGDLSGHVGHSQASNGSQYQSAIGAPQGENGGVEHQSDTQAPKSSPSRSTISPPQKSKRQRRAPAKQSTTNGDEQ